MGWFIFALIFLAVAVVGFVWSSRVGRSIAFLESKRGDAEEADASKKRDAYSGFSNTSKVAQLDAAVGNAKLTRRIVAGVTAFFVILTVWFLAISTVFTQGVGEAKVITNLDGTIAGEKLDPGFGVKAPWQDIVDFDLFSQEVLYAGGDAAPSYSGGTVSGKEVTVAVGGVNGGSTQANVDISITYSLDAEQVTELYSKYKSQERFTKQVVEKTILSTVREIPANFNAIEFRGKERQNAADQILEALNDKLNKQGINVDFVNIQDIRYPEQVENALKEVEVQNQAAQAAEAKQRTAEVEAETKLIEAQGVANAEIERARGTAEANRQLNESLTPSVLQQRYIDALNEGTIFVVPEGSQPMVNTGK